MFLFEKIRQGKLERALETYSIYDPPHRKEERLLPVEQARENFDYFMAHKDARLAGFLAWFERHFALRLKLDEAGLRALEKWGKKYAVILISSIDPLLDDCCYYDYGSPWDGRYKCLNVIFDTGIFLGEALIARCPMLRWEMDPILAVLPRTARLMKHDRGSGYRRPTLACDRNPAWYGMPCYEANNYFRHMYFRTKKNTSIMAEKAITGHLSSFYINTVNTYPDFLINVHGIGKSMEEYFASVDQESEWET
ncbi:UNVERIFIED_CONTAM: hypothetical protein Q9R58_18165 [Methylobacteriaceae bacterium AG10]|nr:hypothetical protein [Methylobacteriaceae bacterium AG10]